MDLRLICADGRFVTVPGGVFYVDGPMTEPVDAVALTGALQAGRVPGATAVFVTEATRTRADAVERVRRRLSEIAAPVRDRYVLGTLPGEHADLDAWQGVTDTFGLSKHASYRPDLTSSPRVVPLDRAGLQTENDPVAVRVLPRAQAAARETLRAALDDASPSWDRLTGLVARAAAIRDELRVTLRMPGDEQRERAGAAYALAAGIALFGVPADADPAALLRLTRPLGADEVTGVWGGDQRAVNAAELVSGLVAAPGSGALVRADPDGAGRPRLGWLVSRPDGLAWIDPELDGDTAIRVMPPDDAISLLRALPGQGPAALRVDARGRPISTAAPSGPTRDVTPVNAAPVDASAGLAAPVDASAGLVTFENASAGSVAAEAGPVSDAALARLETLVAEVAETRTTADVLACTVLLHRFRDRLFPDGIRAGEVRDDIRLGTRRGANEFGSADGWPLVGSVDAIEAALRDRAPGSVAFVLVSRPGGLGHALAAYRVADGLRWVDLTAEEGARITRHRTARERLTGGGPAAGGVSMRALVADESGRRIPIAASGAITTAAALLDPPGHVDYAGSGLEVEFPDLLIFPDGVEDTLGHASELVIHRSGLFRIVAEKEDLYLGGDGVLYRTPEVARANGQRNPTRVYRIIPELVTGVMRTVPGEDDYVGLADVEPLLRAAEVRRADARGRGLRLADMFPRADGFRVTEAGQGAVVAGRPVGSESGARFQHTVGVPPGGLREFLQHVLEHTWRPGSARHLEAALAFGDYAAARFLARRDLGAGWEDSVPFPAGGLTRPVALDPHARQLAGYLALLYSNAAGIAHGVVYAGLGKDNLAVAGRNTMAFVVDELPQPVRDHLGHDAVHLADAFRERVQRTVEELDERAAPLLRRMGATRFADVPYPVRTHHGEDPASMERLFGGTAHTYFQRGLRGSPDDPFAEVVVDQFRSLNVGAVPAPDRGNGELPLVVMEVRSYGERLQSVVDGIAHHRTLTDVARSTFARERQTLPAVTLPAIDALERLVPQRIPFDTERHDLSRDAAVAVDRIAGRVADLSRATGVPLDLHVEGGGRGGWLGVGAARTADRRVEAVRGRLEPALAAQHLPAHAVRYYEHNRGNAEASASGASLTSKEDQRAVLVWVRRRPQGQSTTVFRAAVRYDDPPSLPPALRGLDAEAKRDALRGHVGEAADRIGTVLERFPNSDAAVLWRTAVAGLENAAEGLGHLFEQAAATLIQLDPTVVDVLAPLWSGRGMPARPVPAPRAIGPWTTGDLTAMATGLGRPLLTVDLSGRTPHAVDGLEHALREHEWWGEAPIVVATLGTRATNDAFAVLRERYRPITIQPAVTADLDVVQRLIDQDGTVAAEAPALTADLLRTAAALPAAPHGTALPPVLAGLLTAGDDAARYHRRHADQLTDPGVRAALDTLIGTGPDGERLAGFRVALGLDSGPAERLVPVATGVLEVEPAYTGGPVPASFAYDFLARPGGREERFALDGLLFQIVLAGRMGPPAALELLRAGAQTAVDRAVTGVFEAAFDVLALSEREAAADPGTDGTLKAILAKVERVTGTARPDPASAPPDCVDPIDRAAFVGRLDALRDTLRADDRPAAAALIETITYVLSNC
ncbi:hypothetical protein [Catenuloplanes japonicus]|uniref:hypothetical protein n=1 Tax=Catenuloplanes japonicus TaxID=33876 RepID=UPI000526CE7A|nr:hypothetical protein [Catenuloplanes japonicus]